MINNISWSSYWSAMTILLVIYYAYVLLIYYRGDLRNRLAGKNSLLSAGSFQSTSSGKEKSNHSESGIDELTPVVQSLSDEMTAYLGQAAYAKAGKAEIIFALQQITKKYEGIKKSPYQQSVNKLIEFECKEICAVHLNDEEIKQVWMD